MTIEFFPEYPVAKLKPERTNPRAITDEAQQKLRESINRWGVIKPLVIDAADHVLAGNQRSKVLAADNVETVPVFKATHRLMKQDRLAFMQEHNRLYQMPEPVPVSVPSGPVGKWEWVLPTMDGNFYWQGESKVRMQHWRQTIRQIGPVGSIVALGDGTIVEGHVWAAYCALTRNNALVYRVPEDPNGDLWSAGDFYLPLDITAGRHTRIRRERVSPLYRLIRKHWDEDESDNRVLDIGCGFGRHFRLMPEFKFFGYEPWINLPDDPEAFDLQMVRQQLARIAHDVATNGLYKTVVLDHVLFTMQDIAIAEKAVAAAASMCAEDGTVWASAHVPRYKDRISASGAYIGGRVGRQYRLMHLDRDRLRAMFEPHFEKVHIAREVDLQVRATGPTTRDITSVEAEFNLPYPGGVHHGGIEPLLEALEDIYGRR